MCKKALCWIFVIIWLLLIFNFSANNGIKSNGQSKGLAIGILAEGTFFAKKIGLIKDNLTQKQLETLLEEINRPLRKLAHMLIYLVLAILVLFALETKDKTLLRNSLLVMLVCFIYSITDEYHQTLVPGRSGALFDCFIDTSGAVLGCLLYGLLLKLKIKKY